MQIQSTITVPRTTGRAQGSSVVVYSPAPPAPPADSFTPSRGSKIARGFAKAGLIAAGAGLGAWVGSSSGVLPGLAGGVLGTAGGATLGFVGGAASAALIPTDENGLGNVAYGTIIGAVGGLAAGIASGGFHSTTMASIAMGVLGAGVGTFAAIQV